jgi:hypothetical protein
MVLCLKGIEGTQTLIKRMGDIYLGKSIIELPPIPSVYRKFIPEDYATRITKEERTTEFYVIGDPNITKRAVIKSDSNTGKVLGFLLGQINQEFLESKIEETGLSRSLYSILREARDAFNLRELKCFELGNVRRKTWKFSTLNPPKGYVESLRAMDESFGLSTEDSMWGISPRDSLDSALL